MTPLQTSKKKHLQIRKRIPKKLKQNKAAFKMKKKRVELDMFTLLCHQAQLRTSQPSNPSQFWKMGHGAASWGICQNFKKKLTFVDLHWPGFSQKFHLKGPNASEICGIRFFLSNLPKRYHSNEIRSFVLTILSNHSGWIELGKKTSLNLETRTSHASKCHDSPCCFMKLGSKKKISQWLWFHAAVSMSSWYLSNVNIHSGFFWTV